MKKVFFILLLLILPGFIFLFTSGFFGDISGIMKMKEKSSLGEEIAYVHVPEINSNLVDRNNHYCKFALTLAVPESEVKKLSSDSQLIVIKDSIMNVITNYSYQQLQTVQAKNRLKWHFKEGLNRILRDDSVIQEVYFREFVLQ